METNVPKCLAFRRKIHEYFPPDFQSLNFEKHKQVFNYRTLIPDITILPLNGNFKQVFSLLSESRYILTHEVCF